MKTILILSLLFLAGCAASAKGVGIFKGCGMYVASAGGQLSKEAIEEWNLNADDCQIEMGNDDEGTIIPEVPDVDQ